MVLIIDNYDSFTWNIYQYFCELGAKVIVCRYDKLLISDIIKLSPNKIVISPGPGTPDDFSMLLKVIHNYVGILPILGICLGHQAIAQAFGAKIVRAAKIMHGKISLIKHSGCGVFYNLNNPLSVIRYNSLIIESSTVPSCLESTAWSDTSEIMGIRHKRWKIEGVQFHPESILSEQGHRLLANFLKY